MKYIIKVRDRIGEGKCAPTGTYFDDMIKWFKSDPKNFRKTLTEMVKIDEQNIDEFDKYWQEHKKELLDNVKKAKVVLASVKDSVRDMPYMNKARLVPSYYKFDNRVTKEIFEQSLKKAQNDPRADAIAISNIEEIILDYKTDVKDIGKKAVGDHYAGYHIIAARYLNSGLSQSVNRKLEELIKTIPW